MVALRAGPIPWSCVCIQCLYIMDNPSYHPGASHSCKLVLLGSNPSSFDFRAHDILWPQHLFHQSERFSSIHGSPANGPSWSLLMAVVTWASVGMLLGFQEGSHASENENRVPQMDLCGACSRKGREGGQGWNKDMMSMTLALGTKYKEAPKNLSNPRKYM